LLSLRRVFAAFQIFLWPASDDFRSAVTIELVGRFPPEYIIRELEPGTVYAARISAWSAGGDGKKSPVVYFTIGMYIQVVYFTIGMYTHADRRTDGRTGPRMTVM
jgi:hypothetical protein